MELAGGGGLIGRTFPVIPQDEENATFKAALHGGINSFHTAEMYGPGASPQSLATVLKAAHKSERELSLRRKGSYLLRTVGRIRRSIEDLCWPRTPSEEVRGTPGLRQHAGRRGAIH
jgi:aryl-alcohol dehydrogenase-like predicted oxidoreductase